MRAAVLSMKHVPHFLISLLAIAYISEVHDPIYIDKLQIQFAITVTRCFSARLIIFGAIFVNYSDLSGNNRGSIYFRLRVYMSRARLSEGQSVNINSKYLSLRFIFRHDNFLAHVEDRFTQCD